MISKYNVPVPRYNSYPTVPHWDKSSFSSGSWAQDVQEAFKIRGSKEGLSLYIHLPFCESLCAYCGGNTRITVNHSVEMIYINAVLNEWQLYLQLFGARPTIKELYLGGGTPTFFCPENLELLLKGILQYADISKDHDFSFEGHPDNTTEEHLQMFYELGFRRVSFGIHDFDPKVQDIINRKQSFGQLEYVTDLARLIGYTSINFDLIYGLPLQTLESITVTFEKIKLLKPDSIAFYSYAHVPWIKPGQRKFTEAHLPDSEIKRSLYEAGRSMIEGAGYKEIGMDYFAFPDDTLYKALLSKNLHRNFMGYTTTGTSMLIGLGCSAISDIGTSYARNIKSVEAYQKSLNENTLPCFTGHKLSVEDQIIRNHMQNLICQHRTSWDATELQCEALYTGLDRLSEMESVGLIERNSFSMRVTEKGKPYLRNICSMFDMYLNQQNSIECSFQRIFN